MSQAELGAAAGVTFQQIQKYEGGRNRISAVRLFECAGALSVPLLYFFEDAPDLEQVADPNCSSKDAVLLTEALRKRDGVALMQAYMQIKNQRVRQSIVCLVRSVAGGEGEADAVLGSS